MQTTILVQNLSICLLQNATVLLQIAPVITKCVNFITKCDGCYKMCRDKSVLISLCSNRTLCCSFKVDLYHYDIFNSP